jgi:hypothetical protein
MPENPETKPEEAKPQGEKPSEKPEAGAQAQPRQGGRQYVDYDKLSSEDAAVMLKRIRARVKRIEKDIDEIMAILKYGASAGAPQGQNQGGGQGRRYQGGYRQGYRRNYGYNRYGGRRYSQRRNDEDVNYE